MDGKIDHAGGGCITVQLTCDTPIQTGAIAVSNALEDIKHSGILDSGITNYMSAKSTDVAVEITAAINNDFLRRLSNVVSKLDVFVQVVDKASKVCVWIKYTTDYHLIQV